MTLTKGATMDFVATPVHKPTREGIMVISAMPSHRIIGHLMYRHRVGLLLTANLAWVSWEVYSKVQQLGLWPF